MELFSYFFTILVWLVLFMAFKTPLST